MQQKWKFHLPGKLVGLEIDPAVKLVDTLNSLVPVSDRASTVTINFCSHKTVKTFQLFPLLLMVNCKYFCLEYLATHWASHGHSTQKLTNYGTLAAQSFVQEDVCQPVWPAKSRQMSTKLPKNDFTRKFKDFDTYTKMAIKCGLFGPNNFCQSL